jgi:uncharacterized protein YggU (UPF0235/DUF167 family)
MYVKVWVVAGAKQERIKARGTKGFDVWVKEPATGNRANTRVRELMARHFDLSVHAVRIWSGHHTPSKMLVVDM